MNVCIVIPTYNERENIRILVPEIFKIFENSKIDGRIIVVDDNSPDGTSGAVSELGKNYNVSLIKREKKMGLGSAYIAGFYYALKNSDIIFEMDADLSHDPLMLPLLAGELKNCDIVIGSRYIPGGRIENWNTYRILVSLGANFFARHLLKLQVKDITTGYRAYRNEVLSSNPIESITSNGYAFQAEILYHASMRGYRIKEVPIVFKDRQNGKSKLSKRDIVNFFSFCFRTFFKI